MDWISDFFKNKEIVSALVVLVGGILGFLKFILTRKGENLKVAVTELSLFNSVVDTFKNDPKYAKFIEDLRKERLSYAAFGLSIRNDELGPLMEYYDSGRATVAQINLAWSYRHIDANRRLSFRVKGLNKFLVYLSGFYIVACLVLALLSLVPVLLNFKSNLSFLVFGVFCFLASVVMFYGNRGLYIARILSREDNGRLATMSSTDSKETTV